MKPELDSLNRVAWQLFCTFTFKRTVPEAIRATMFFSTMRRKASNFGVHFKEMIWCLRRESGEITGREHLHALIAGLPAYGITERACRATESIWKAVGGGFAVVRVYDASLDGAEYILKGLEQACGKCREGANLYEFQKFGRASEITLSESLVRVVHGRRQLAKRSRLRTAPSEVSQSPQASRPGGYQVPSCSPVRSGGTDYDLQTAERCAEHIAWIKGYV